MLDLHNTMCVNVEFTDKAWWFDIPLSLKTNNTPDGNVNTHGISHMDPQCTVSSLLTARHITLRAKSQ